eukprot:363337-Chlamydomonas_euryale.AAC.7
MACCHEPARRVALRPPFPLPPGPPAGKPAAALSSSRFHEPGFPPLPPQPPQHLTFGFVPLGGQPSTLHPSCSTPGPTLKTDAWYSTRTSEPGHSTLKSAPLELVDCDTEKDQGCMGGLMNNAYEYIVANGGIDTEDDYAYWSAWGGTFWTCNRRKEADRPAVNIDGYEEVPEGDEQALLKAATQQPVSVGICANSLMYYSSGILDACCDGLNHGVLVTGYATDSGASGAKHYIVKNSWGAGWGEKGYFRLAVGGGQQRQEGGLCGIATAASYPVKSRPNLEVPSFCDVFGWTECAAGSSCSCSWSLFGFLCLWHDCCPLAGGVTCDDLAHCCPADKPVCDVQRGLCVSADGAASEAWTDKTPATVAEAAERPAEQQQQQQREAAQALGLRGAGGDKFRKDVHVVQ